MNRTELLSFRTRWCKKKTCSDPYKCEHAHREVNDGVLRRNPQEFFYYGKKCEKVTFRDYKNTIDYANKCPDGDECKFAHTREEVMYHPDVYKTQLCEDWQTKEKCPRDWTCAFAHGKDELRQPDSYTGGANGDLLDPLDPNFQLMGDLICTIRDFPPLSGQHRSTSDPGLSSLMNSNYGLAATAGTVGSQSMSNLLQLFSSGTGTGMNNPYSLTNSERIIIEADQELTYSDRHNNSLMDQLFEENHHTLQPVLDLLNPTPPQESPLQTQNVQKILEEQQQQQQQQIPSVSSHLDKTSPILSSPRPTEIITPFSAAMTSPLTSTTTPITTASPNANILTQSLPTPINNTSGIIHAPNSNNNISSNGTGSITPPMAVPQVAKYHQAVQLPQGTAAIKTFLPLNLPTPIQPPNSQQQQQQPPTSLSRSSSAVSLANTPQQPLSPSSHHSPTTLQQIFQQPEHDLSQILQVLQQQIQQQQQQQQNLSENNNSKSNSPTRQEKPENIVHVENLVFNTKNILGYDSLGSVVYEGIYKGCGYDQLVAIKRIQKDNSLMDTSRIKTDCTLMLKNKDRKSVV